MKKIINCAALILAAAMLMTACGSGDGNKAPESVKAGAR